MPVRKSKLYNVFGEIIYTLAIADGIVQREEIQTIKNALCHHEWANGIMWSFDYESKKQRNTANVLKQALNVLKENGPSEEYHFLINLLKQVAESSNGIDAYEDAIISEVEEQLKDLN